MATYAGLAAAFLIASNCNQSGCMEIVVATVYGPVGFELCQTAADNFNKTGIFTIVAKSTEPVVFSCKPYVVESRPKQNL